MQRQAERKSEAGIEGTGRRACRSSQVGRGSQAEAGRQAEERRQAC
jgi:cation transport regulator ChaC